MKGWGQKVRYVPRNPGKANFLAGYPGILPGYPRGARKVKVCVQFSSPILDVPHGLEMSNPIHLTPSVDNALANYRPPETQKKSKKSLPAPPRVRMQVM